MAVVGGIRQNRKAPVARNPVSSCHGSSLRLSFLSGNTNESCNGKLRPKFSVGKSAYIETQNTSQLDLR